MERSQAAQTILSTGYRRSMEHVQAAGRYQQAARF
jgi:hypothetical protein